MKRIAISLDEHAHAELALRAQAAAEPVARTAARFVRDGLLNHDLAPKPPAEVASAQADDLPVQSAAWLEPPPAGRERWRRETWTAVCALQSRYTKPLDKLPEDWWTDRSLVECLSALCSWRSALDAGASQDPRTELLFHDRLEILERQLDARRNYGPPFKGGAPPADWLSG